MLGNNMFAYCGNSPIDRSDPTGNAFVHVGFNYTDTSDLLFPTLGGSSGGSIMTIGYTFSGRHGEGKLKESTKEVGVFTGYGSVLPWEFSALTLNYDSLSIVDASVALFDATYELKGNELTLLRGFSLEASTGITRDDGLHAKAMVSIASSSLTLDLGIATVSVTGYLGAIGAMGGVNVDGFCFGYALGAGWSIDCSLKY